MHFRRWFTAAGWCAAVLVIHPLDATAQWITVIESVDGSSCYMPDIPTPGQGTAHIIAFLAPGPTSNGITGAEFRVVGMPPEMGVTAIPNPLANLDLGNPFGDGCNIAFPTCQTGSSGIVLLYTVQLFVPPTGVPHYVLDVEQHASPSGPNFPCPLVTLCDAPVFTKVCVNGIRSGPGPLLQVPSNPAPVDAATGVAPTTDLAWELAGPSFCCGIGTGSTAVFFGTSPSPPHVATYETGETTYDPGELEPLTTYYWRILTTPDHDCGAVSGPVWSFSTGDKVGIEATTWQAVKGMFR